MGSVSSTNRTSIRWIRLLRLVELATKDRIPEQRLPRSRRKVHRLDLPGGFSRQKEREGRRVGIGPLGMVPDPRAEVPRATDVERTVTLAEEIDPGTPGRSRHFQGLARLTAAEGRELRLEVLDEATEVRVHGVLPPRGSPYGTWPRRPSRRSPGRTRHASTIGSRSGGGTLEPRPDLHLTGEGRSRPRSERAQRSSARSVPRLHVRPISTPLPSLRHRNRRRPDLSTSPTGEARGARPPGMDDRQGLVPLNGSGMPCVRPLEELRSPDRPRGHDVRGV